MLQPYKAVGISMSPQKAKKDVARPRDTPSPDVVESAVMTLRDVAEYLHCHYTTAHRLARLGSIPSFMLGGSWRFLKSEIDEWIANGGGRRK